MMADPLEIVVERDGVQRVVQLETERILIGRGVETDVRLDDPLASRNHCRFERMGNEVFVVDLDSANGTWMDGIRIQRRPLALGDTVRVGSTSLRLTGGVHQKLGSMESTQTQQVSREKDMLQTLLGALRGLQEEDKLDRLAALLIDAAVSLSRAERGFVFVFDKDRTVLAMGRNFAREPVPAPEKKVSKTLLERAVKSTRPFLVDDASQDEEFAGVASISDLGLRSLLALPLRSQGVAIGLLLVDHRLATGAFRQDEQELLAGLAAAAGTALGAVRDRVQTVRLRRKNNNLQRQLGQRVASEKEEARRLKTPLETFSGMVGNSPAMQTVFTQIERILPSDVSVLVQGESGTGKELVARALHYGGPRADKAFVTVNCGALPDTLLESELFGHVKGSFTGAIRDRGGRFEEANSGSLFLDEVGEMSTAMQSRLLRTLQEGEVQRLGSDEIRKVDVRLIAATNVDLSLAVKEGRFREDLYYRLKVVEVDLPPLRQRKDDVELLVEHFLAIEATELGRLARKPTPEALSVLDAYAWPGNIRQLRNEMRRLTLLGEGEIGAEELSEEIKQSDGELQGDPGPSASLPDRIAAMEIAAIRTALDEAHGNRSKAASKLGISRFALLRKIEKYGLDSQEETS